MAIVSPVLVVDMIARSVTYLLKYDLCGVNFYFGGIASFHFILCGLLIVENWLKSG